MTTLVFIVLFALGISGRIFAANHHRRHAPRGVLPYEAHIELMKTFPCKKPQLRVFPVEDFIKHPNPSAKYSPIATVLGRCDEHTGCTDCSLSQVCGPKIVEKVQLYFLVHYKSDNSKEHEIVEADDHRECHCMERHD